MAMNSYWTQPRPALLVRPIRVCRVSPKFSSELQSIIREIWCCCGFPRGVVKLPDDSRIQRSRLSFRTIRAGMLYQPPCYLATSSPHSLFFRQGGGVARCATEVRYAYRKLHSGRMLRQFLTPVVPRLANATCSAASFEAWDAPLWRIVSAYMTIARYSTSAQGVGTGSGGRCGNPAVRPPPEVPFAVKGLKHIAVAVPDLAAAAEHYRSAFGAHVSDPQALPDHGVTSVFVRLPNVNIELLHPLGDKSPISKFLERNPKGGIHHICLAVDNLNIAVEHLSGLGVSSVGDGQPKIGAEGGPVLFLNPKDTFGVLTELQQANPGIKEEVLRVAYV